MYNFKVESIIMKAMNNYNKNTKEDKFAPYDAIIFSAVKSFSIGEGKCYLTNEQLSELTLVNTVTVQKSINRLCTHELIYKYVKKMPTSKVRNMSYNKCVLYKFVEENVDPKEFFIWMENENGNKKT